MRHDLLQQILAATDEHGPAPALSGPRDATLTHAQLGARVRAVAHRLRAAGFGPGERLLFSVRPSPDAVVLALGTVAAGGTVVFVDPGAGGELFAARVALVEPRWAAAESVLYAASAPGPLRSLARRRGVLLPDFGALPVRHVRAGRWLPGVPRGALPLRDLTRPVARPDPIPSAPDQDAAIVPTAGTTAAPKVVVHTRASLGAALGVLATRCALAPGTRVHTDQLLLGLPALVAGAHWTMPPYGFAPAARPAELARGMSGATHAFLVPADLAGVLDAVERGEVALPASLRQVLLGAAPVLPPLLRRATALLPGVEFLAVYGMTEILPVAVATAQEKLAYAGPGDLIGAPLPGVAVRVDDRGELHVAGPNMARGYLGRPDPTEHATGDLARLSGGRIVLVGRAKDMIIRGSTNIYPGLYEPAVAALPGVAAALMVGVADDIGDERVVLAIVPAPDAGRDLADRVRAALPSLIDTAALPDEVVVLDALPVAGRTRKPDRAAVRAMFA
ncbi:acyl-CoA synthetase (AMP-forming)/AMP-acid ligase II [Pseudonocardia hierapolitana]|uniref:Acyl-CoA synthetase (AMP-forming)/AMP-acid ligase II n=1 Tax=Pseudonocardia hierapolitana TaxID=1128676 RepID=A0A561SP24_9PSEU|nr:class I adenylate-forming enzyme family protein [Pseudonocardia hierapolitana]TWF76619.1 acyl-CoA synthetase (AMP-forming)/AMP-acid ligase II [Pseudonocardia hierapolitana]